MVDDLGGSPVGDDPSADDEQLLRETLRLYDRVSLTQAARTVLVPVLTLLRGPRI